MTPLFQELHRWKTLPFEWGVCDCCLVVADWVWRVKGQDPAAHIRGMYDDVVSCERLTGFIRHPVDAIEACAQTIGGLPRVETAGKGDIAILRRLDAPARPFAGVWTGTHWAGKAQDGVTVLDPRVAQPIAIWGLDYA